MGNEPIKDIVRDILLEVKKLSKLVDRIWRTMEIEEGKHE